MHILTTLRHTPQRTSRGAQVKRTVARGFTIVELLIVILVIAILAAISVVAYVGVQNRANDTVVRQDLAKISKKLEMVRVTRGVFPEAADFPSGLKISRLSYDYTQGNVYYIVSLDGNHYALGVRPKSGMDLILTDSGVMESGTVNSHATSSSIKATWADGLFKRQGHNGTTWTTWSLVAD